MLHAKLTEKHQGTAKTSSCCMSTVLPFHYAAGILYSMQLRVTRIQSQAPEANSELVNTTEPTAAIEEGRAQGAAALLSGAAAISGAPMVFATKVPVTELATILVCTALCTSMGV